MSNQSSKYKRMIIEENGKVIELAKGANGAMYYVDPKTGKARKAYKTVMSFEELAGLDIPTVEFPMVTYQRYLRDRFEEDCPIKKGKLHFRGFRVSVTVEDGFQIEDTENHYEVLDTSNYWEGFPTPKQLGDFFDKPKRVVHTAEELARAVELGKKLQAEKREAQEALADLVDEVVDWEALRRKVLTQIERIRTKVDTKFDPEDFSSMIPYRRWRKAVTTKVNLWKSKQITYKKLLNAIEQITTEETFAPKIKPKRTTFVGTVLRKFERVGNLYGNQIEVDGKLVEAVPFLLEYLLHFEPRCMQQLMRWAKGEVTQEELLNEPIYRDGYIEYEPALIENTEHNARIISLVYVMVDLCTPQEMLYPCETELQVGDYIMLFDNADGEWVRKKIKKCNAVDGICISGGVGILKTDKWYKTEYTR